MATLSSLMQAHVARIPWGNIDIHTGAPVSPLPQPPDVAAERVLDGRGGYCFHLVPPFCALLNSLGFHANIYRGQLYNHRDSDFGSNANAHAVVLVSGVADAPTQQVLADIAIGDGPRNPMPLREGVHHDANTFAYRLEQVGDARERRERQRRQLRGGGDGGRWRFVHDARGGFQHFDFDTGPPVDMSAFAEPHRLLSTLPESVFVQTFTVQRVDDGHIDKIVNRVFRRLSADSTTEEPIGSAQRLGSLLRETFELSVSDADVQAIWDGMLRRERAEG